MCYNYIIMEEEMRERLNTFGVAEIKKIMRIHNLHFYMRLTQNKAGLINSIITHLKLNGDILKPVQHDDISLKDFRENVNKVSGRRTYSKEERDKKKAEKAEKAEKDRVEAIRIKKKEIRKMYQDRVSKEKKSEYNKRYRDKKKAY